MIVSYCDLSEANACLHSAGSESMGAKTDYCCDMTTIIGMPTPATHRILLGTVTENKKLYTKREVAGADKAREMLARMGYPPVKQAMCSSGKNLVRYHRTRFLNYGKDAIYGKDIASITPAGFRDRRQLSRQALKAFCFQGQAHYERWRRIENPSQLSRNGS
jgi:hypothetical protein